MGIGYADQNVTFQWDQNSETIDGYRLFKRDQEGQYDYNSPAWEGSVNTATLTLQNGSFAFVVRAFLGNNESGDSNEVLFSIEDSPPPIIIPSRPKSFTIIFE